MIALVKRESSKFNGKNLFQPFLTSRVKGTGLGMAIVNKIVKAHGGELKIHSRTHRGTSVRFFLPIVVSGGALYSEPRTLSDFKDASSMVDR